MMEWNAETVLDALNDFERKPELSPVLDEYLQRIAKNGEIVFPWCKLKPLLKKKLEVVLDEFYEACPVETSVPVPNFETFNFDNLKKSILQEVESFTSAPFTIQRLCELVTNPQKHYNRTDKYMRGIEKNVLVVSTIEPRTGGQVDGNNGNNIIVNGMINDSPNEDDALNGHENESIDSVSSSNMNTPSNHVLLENFANVFPSAACIPSASNICINREIDNNFISTSGEEEAPQDVAFEASASATEPAADSSAQDKDEAMDTSEEDHSNGVAEVTTGEAESLESQEVLDAEELKSESEPTKDEDSEPHSTELEDVSVDIEVEKKAEFSEITSAVMEDVKPDSDEAPQDDTVSQSDHDPVDRVDVPDIEASSDSCNSEVLESEEPTNEERVTETEPVVLEEISSNDSDSASQCESELTDSCMELESDKGSDIPPE